MAKTVTPQAPKTMAADEKVLPVGLEPSRQMNTRRGAPTDKMDSGQAAAMSGKMQPFTEDDC